MTDTPQHIKDLQLKIWLSKPPEERLRQFLIDNEVLYNFWRQAKQAQQTQSNEETDISDVPSTFKSKISEHFIISSL